MALPNRQVLLVAGLFAVSFTVATCVVVSGSLVGDLLASDRLATLPISLGVVGLVGASFPASKAMARWGRRPVFQAAATVGLAGGLLGAWAVHAGSFPLFCLASLLIGSLGGAGSYYRFTAGEVAAPADRERAFGVVLGGGVVGGLVGPPSAVWAADLVAERFVGTYLLVALLCVLLLLLLGFLRAPAPVAGGTAHAKLRADRPFAAAVLAGALAYGAMVLTMYAAPLSLDHLGHSDATKAGVLQAHVIAMFLPSFVTGALVQRVGPGKGMAAGLVTLAACVGINLAGAALANYYVSLVLLGLGWNLLFVSATALLARSHAGDDKASAQGTNELLVGACSAAAAFLAGPALAALGWRGLNLAVGALLAAAALALLGLMRPRTSRQAADAMPVP